MTLQHSLFISVYNGMRQYKDKMDLIFLQSNQVQLSAQEEKKNKTTTHHNHQMFYSENSGGWTWKNNPIF